MNSLVSIIVPAYNVEQYIGDVIESVLRQTYPYWELLIINDGSTDKTETVIQTYQDNRIRYFYQTNSGVGVARNCGLQHMSGSFFCFLDGDDVFPPNSLESRLEIFAKDPSLDFVDGVVVYRSENLEHQLRKHCPSFRGEPYNQLLRLNPACLFGNTWMIKRKDDVVYKFNEGLTHAEDLYFYLTISKRGGKYSFTDQEILWYRQRSSSAMRNLKGLEKGYQSLYKLVKRELGASRSQLLYLKYKISRIMFASYLGDQRNVYEAVRSLIRNVSL